MDELDQVIDEINEDTISGSAALADKLIRILIKLAPQLTTNQKKDILKKIERLGREKPFFAVLSHFTATIRKPETNWYSLLIEYQHRIDQANLKISEQFTTLLGTNSKTLLLHSHSKTILSTLEKLVNKSNRITIIQTISEPGREGMIQARALQKQGFEVKLVEDDPEPSILKNADIFVTGADLIFSSHFVNKVGTRSIAEKIRENGKDYFVLADQRKFTTEHVRDLPPEFEFIPRSLITNLITGA